jgi:hypothetical protein
MSKLKLSIYLFLFVVVSCSTNEKSKESEEAPDPTFCDCVNKDYHNKGDKEKCLKLEKDLTLQLSKASKDEKGEILMKIQDCKVKGQYDND